MEAETKKTETPAAGQAAPAPTQQNGDSAKPKKTFMGVDLDKISLESKKELIKATINKTTPNATKEEKKERAKILMKIFDQGATLKEVIGLSDTEFAEIYSFAYYQLKQGKYEEGKELFKFLWSLEPNNADFVTSIGVCYHHLKDYEMASVYYMLADSLKPTDPLPYFYLYDCFMNLKHVQSACMVLQAVLVKAGNNPKYEALIERTNFLLKSAEHQALIELGYIKPDKDKEA